MDQGAQPPPACEAGAWGLVRLSGAALCRDGAIGAPWGTAPMSSMPVGGTPGDFVPPVAPRAAWQNPDDKSEDVFILGALVSTDTDKEVSKVRIKAGGAEVQVRATDVSSANPAGLTAPDNCMLIHLSEATLLENVRARYFTKEIYTLTGSILLAMNPFETLPIYSEAKMEPYKGKPLGKAPAHVYGTAESAYQMLSRTKQPQSIVVSGESGAGKTETNKHLMYYLAWRSKSGGGIETLAEAILQVRGCSTA